MRRLLALLAAGLLALTLAPSVHASDGKVISSGGDGAHGTFQDTAYGGPDHFMYAEWDQGNHDRIGSGTAVQSTIFLSIDANYLPDTPAGHHTCVQIAVDWRVPSFENHYDARILVDCQAYSHVEWHFNEGDTNNSPGGKYCLWFPGGYDVPCSSPMGRVQFARYDRTTGDVIGPIDCRAMSGVALSDCTDWRPFGSLPVSRIKERNTGGTITYGSLDATNPNA